jgi:hypothetical protein
VPRRQMNLESGSVVLILRCDSAAGSGANGLRPPSLRPCSAGLSDEVCVVVVTDSALVAGKDTDDHQEDRGSGERVPEHR